MPSTKLQTMLSSFMSTLSSVGSESESSRSKQNSTLIIMGLICIVAPLDTAQLVFGVVGALAYAGIQTFKLRAAKSNCQRQHDRKRSPRTSPRTMESNRSKYATPVRGRATSGGLSSTPPASPVKPDTYQRSSVPVVAPKFESVGFEAEVSELVPQLNPGQDEERAVQHLVQHVQKIIKTMFPDVEVSGFAHGSLKCGKAFGVAVPEVDIVANISPLALSEKLQQRSRTLDVKKMQKAAIRLCTDKLVSSGGLKFRRSAFRGEEPRVTLLVPAGLGIFSDAVPVDFSINSITPFYAAALLTECGQMEPRAKALILLVKRWAKDRGICHAAKGHLSPYLWSLLVMYFMQVGVEEEGQLLPKLEAFKIANLATSTTAASLTGSSKPASNSPRSPSSSRLSVAQLFNKFVDFYGQHFNFRSEAVSVRLGRRTSPCLSLPLHVLVCEDSTTTDVAPTIEDPFQPASNLGTCMNALTLRRMKEELVRAMKLCANDASLTELLQPWVPVEETPERNGGSSPSEHEVEQSPGKKH